MEIEVYKFGGASVKDAEGVKNVANIIAQAKGKKILLVVSATGKTTNALQTVVDDHFSKEKDAFESLEPVKDNHIQILKNLFTDSEQMVHEIQDAFVEIEWMIEEEAEDDYDFAYDQIVSVGEIVSSKILNGYLESQNLKSLWLDVRDVLITDNTYREAKVDWEETEKRISQKVLPLFDKFDVVVTQGFIGSTTENFTSTLGREGSDFTASIFSYCLSANAMSIWKDVPGVLTGDPRLFENVTKLDNLSYREAIEMTYYGAKVIHPKTIKPLQNKNIPLLVKSFEDPTGLGTKISDLGATSYPPIVVFEHNQCMLRISTKDFSFIAEDHLSEIFEKIAQRRVKVKMMKNTAVSFVLSVDDQEKRVNQLIEDLSPKFVVVKEDDLELLTIRHYNEAIIKSMTKERVILFEEKIKDTIQLLVKPISTMQIKS